MKLEFSPLAPNPYPYGGGMGTSSDLVGGPTLTAYLGGNSDGEAYARIALAEDYTNGSAFPKGSILVTREYYEPGSDTLAEPDSFEARPFPDTVEGYAEAKEYAESLRVL